MGNEIGIELSETKTEIATLVALFTGVFSAGALVGVDAMARLAFPEHVNPLDPPQWFLYSQTIRKVLFVVVLVSFGIVLALEYYDDAESDLSVES